MALGEDPAIASRVPASLPVQVSDPVLPLNLPPQPTSPVSAVGASRLQQHDARVEAVAAVRADVGVQRVLLRGGGTK